MDDQVEVNPYEVRNDTGKEIDYDKLIKLFGCEHIEPAMIEKFEKLTGKPAHHLLRRGIFFSHRDLAMVLDKYEKG
jgi:tryptophanyl-tRNA synthetase